MQTTSTSNIYEQKCLAGLYDISIFQWSQNFKPKETNKNYLSWSHFFSDGKESGIQNHKMALKITKVEQ